MELLKLTQLPQAKFSGKLLAWARESRGLSQTDLAGIIGASQSYVSKIEDELQSVSQETLTRLESALAYPVDFYFQGEPANEPVALFRRHLTLKSSLLKQAAARMRIMRLRLLRLAESVEGPPVIVPRLSPDSFPGGSAGVARHVRAMWNIPAGPIANLTRIVEDAGCFVIPFDFGTDKIDGCSEWAGGVPIIFVNASIPTARMRAVIGHELGHLVMHTTEHEEAEDQAFRFAGELLAPEAEIKSSLLPMSLDRLARLKLRWNVSMQLLLKRAEELNVISARAARYHWMLLGRAGYRETEPYDYEIPKEQPALLRELLETHLVELGQTKEHLAKHIWAADSEFEFLYSGRPQIRLAIAHTP